MPDRQSDDDIGPLNRICDPLPGGSYLQHRAALHLVD